MNRTSKRQLIPPLVTGYPLSNVRLSVYQPVAAVNIVDNPSIERSTTNYTAVGGSIAQSATRQRWGAYSLAVTPTSGVNDGAYYGGTTPAVLASGTTYYGSVFGYFSPGVPYKIYFASTAGAQVGAATTFIGSGRWQRVIVTYLEVATTNRRLYVTKNNHASTTIFYLDGFNISEVLSTYVDGDQKGLVKGQTAYYWTGIEHQSASVRVVSTRAGGYEMKLTDFGFSTLAIIGLGLGGFSNLSTPNAYVGGSRFERTVYTDRTFDIVGVFQANADGFLDLQTGRKALENVLRPNAGIISQPMILVYQTVSESGEPMGEPVEIACSLEPGGLSGNWNNDYQEPVSLTFKNYFPFMGSTQGFQGAALDFQNVLSSYNLLYRDTNGLWSPMGTGMSSGHIPITAIELPNGIILIGGAFTNVQGLADADMLAYYTFSTDAFTAVNATPLNSFVNSLALKPDGLTVLVGGVFTNAGGFADADFLALLTLATGAYSAINATPLSADVDSILMLPSGNALVLGNFTNAGGAGDADYAVYVVGTTYTAINATPLSARVFHSVRLLNGNVVISGNFTNAGGDANADFIALLTTLTGVYSSLNDDVTPGGATALGLGLDGRLYRFGNDGMYSWQGPSAPWVLLGGQLNGVGQAIATMPDGTLLIGGSDLEKASNPTLFFGGLAGWNGSSFVYPDLLVPSGNDINFILRTRDEKIILGGDMSVATVTAIGITSVNYPGTADTFPVYEFVGPGTLYQIKNYTTGDTIYFDLTLLAGERALLTLGPGSVSFVSTFRGNIYNTILPGSFTSTFRIVPGVNSLGVLIAGTTDSNTSAKSWWRVNLLSADDALYNQE